MKIDKWANQGRAGGDGRSMSIAGGMERRKDKLVDGVLVEWK